MKGSAFLNIKKIKIKDGINLYYVPTTKFKTTAFSFYIHRPITREECTLNSLLSMVLRRACPGFLDSKSISRHLDSLYGVAFSTGVRKKSERHILCANFQFVNDKFLDEDIDIFEKVLDFSESVILKQESFNEEYVNQEKENLKQQILSVMNDKRVYASKRCMEIMCADEPYGIDKLGYIEDLDKIDNNILFNHYKNVILKSPFDLFVNGDVDIDAVAQKLKKMFENIEVEYTIPAPREVYRDVAEVKRVTEEQQVAQGKLSIGFRTNVYVNDEDYPAMMMYNAILGCGIFSKLFNNVREKLSLCYYASSSVDHLKGLMFINSGIEVKNFDRAYDEIMVQMEDIKNGNISDVEMSAAVLGTVNSINSMSDNTFILDDFYLGKIISGKMVEFDEIIESIRKVTKEDVMRVAHKIQLDTVYFLKGCEE